MSLKSDKLKNRQEIKMYRIWTDYLRKEFAKIDAKIEKEFKLRKKI